jgi:hypothetical protein
MSTDHIVHNVITQCMECKHCGSDRAVKMPDTIDRILAQFDAFLAAHEACKVPAPETVMSEYIKGFDAGYGYVLNEIERWQEEVGQDLHVLLAHLRMESTKGRETT